MSKQLVLYFAFCLILSVFAGMGEAFADEVCPDAITAEAALKKGAEAKKAQEAGNHEAALPMLDEALTLCPHPRLLFLKGRSLMALKRYEEAREIYRDLEKKPEFFPQPERMAEIRENLRICDEALHETAVAFSAPGVNDVTFHLDDIEMGPLPQSVNLKRGRYKAVASKPGFEPATQWVDVAQEESRRVEFTLVPQRGASPGGGGDTGGGAGSGTASGGGAPGEGGLWEWVALGGGVVLLGGAAGFWGNYLVQNGKDLAPNQHTEGGFWDVGLGTAMAGAGIGLVAAAVWLWLDPAGEE